MVSAEPGTVNTALGSLYMLPRARNKWHMLDVAGKDASLPINLRQRYERLWP
jgi:hypothetical protein